MRLTRALVLTAALWSSSVRAGPPFLTDDPEPTDTGHWEIYAPLFEATGSGRDFEGSLGAEINYGAVENVQVTIGLPAAYRHDAQGWHGGAGDLEASVKYRFYHNERAGLQVAFFPGVTLPTASRGLGAGHVTALLPVWAQKDFGPWSVFGGGGYAINPGAGNRDYATAGVALTRRFGDRLLLGVEAERQGADAVGGRASTSLGIGAIYDLPGPFRLLASVGPAFEDGGSSAFHSFVALGLDF
jgi:hypothetical protein